ncbi:hypothetical protein ACFQ5G_35345 [Actinoplanes sichuanensis]|uniref:Uncharacterized protein n=2 Tax=Actinoplanes sichuanensis TaxID=512349 RepID=A0ABW4AIK1_9ACTN
MSSRSAIGLLLGIGSALVGAFVFAPAALLSGTYGAYSDETALRDAVGRALVEYWQSGRPQFPALLVTLVDYWFRWHAIKVVISLSMFVVFALLAAALWRRYLHGATRHAADAISPTRRAVGSISPTRHPADGIGRTRHALGAIGATVFTVLVMGVLVLNIQATAVPLVALLPLQAGGGSGSGLDRTLTEMREGLTAPAGSPALTVLLGEAERYQWVMVAMAVTALTVAGLAGAFLWRRRGTGGVRVRFMRRTLTVILALTASLLLLVVAGGVVSAIEPAGTLRAALGLG